MSPKPSEFMDFVLRVKQIERVPGMGYCWEWQGPKCGTLRNYGCMSVRCKMYRVHRIAYALSKGMHPDDLDGVVMHKCDNPSCCNPSHLQLGTQVDNVRDRDQKGRQRTNPIRKLDDCAIAKIIQSSLSHTALAAHYGVSKQAIAYHRKKHAERT